MIPSSKGSNRRTILERNKLFQTTNIASFGHIQSSNSKIETIIWYIVIIVFTILTIRNIITITLEYQNQKPIAAAWLEEWNGDLGDIFVEFPIILPELYNEFYEPHIIYPFPNHYNRSLGADLEKAIAQLDSREKLIGKNSSWPYILLPLMIRFAELMYAFEFPLSAGSEEYITSLSVNELAHDLHMQRVFPYIQNFLNHSAQFNVTHSDLINKWTEELVDQIFRVSFEDRSNGASEVLTPEMFHLMILFKDKYVDQNPTGSVVYRMGFAFKRKLKLSQMHFWRWSFSYKRLIDVVLESGVFDSNFTIDQARHWYLRSFNHKPELAIYKDYYLYDLTSVKVGQDMIKEVKVIYSFRSIGQNCSRKTPAWKCYAKCVTKYFTDTCQCSPLSFDHSHVNTTPCTMDKYVGCRIGQQVARADLHCYEMCPEHCMMSYERVLLDMSEQSDEANDSLKLKFYPTFKKHPVFEETYPLSKMSFWAELGGTFDFWIGASVISVVHLVVYFTKQVIYALKKNTKTGGNLRHLIGSLTSEEGDHYPGFVSLFTLGMTQQRDYDKEVIRDSTFNIKAAREEIELLNDDVQQQQGKINQSDGMLEEQITLSSGNSQQLEERMVRLEGLLKQQIVQENELSRDHEDHLQKLETMITQQNSLPKELDQLNETIKQQEGRIQRLESSVAQQNALMWVPYNVKA